MINFIEGASDKVIAVELTGGYQPDDEKKLEKLFEEKLAKGIKQINFLVKIDKLELGKSSWKAMWDDGMYAMKHMKSCGKIAIVSNKKWEEFLIKVDNAFFESKKTGRIEKYFDVVDLELALGWVNE